jgi:hypothetical protein
VRNPLVAALVLALAGCGSIAEAPDAGPADPVLASVASVSTTAADGYYGVGDSIDIVVTFTSAVEVTGTPQLGLNSGAGPVAYASGSGTTALTFSYTVADGENSLDLDVQSTSALDLAGGTIGNGAGDADVALPAGGGARSLSGASDIVVDGNAPSVVNVTSTNPNGSWATGQVVVIHVDFDDAVVVTGTPTLTLNNGAVVDYTSGSGSATLTFAYTIGTGEVTVDLDYASATALDPAGGAITDVAGNDGDLTLPAPGGPGSLGGNKTLATTSCAGGTTTISFTGAIATFTMPAGCALLTIEAFGAQGGGPRSGLGARIKGTVVLTPGQQIRVLVGGQGNKNYGGGGGGGTFTTRTDNSPLVIAGGGGGEGTDGYPLAANGGPGLTGTAGGSVQGALGGNNGGGGDFGIGAGAGGCGWRGSGGGGLIGNGNVSGNGGGNSFVNGGAASVEVTDPGDCVANGTGGFGGGGAGGNGGGGGGGYSGGAGGANHSFVGDATDYPGGGGGGSFNAGYDQEAQAGVRSGHGQVILTW